MKMKPLYKMAQDTADDLLEFINQLKFWDDYEYEGDDFFVSEEDYAQLDDAYYLILDIAKSVYYQEGRGT